MITAEYFVNVWPGMKKFRASHPNYLSYKTDHDICEITEECINAIGALIDHHSDNDDSLLIEVVNDILAGIPDNPTNNHCRPWLVGDLYSALRIARQKGFPRFMDALGKGIDMLSPAFCEALNAYFEATDFGYEILNVDDWEKREWGLRNADSLLLCSALLATQQLVATQFQQAIEHLNQLIAQIGSGANERARKDALRDALSAVESIYKQLSRTSDIKDAYAALLASGKWGVREALKDGLTIWNKVHHLYPDVRHGQAASTPLSQEEAFYWIDRLLVWIRYMSRMNS